MIKNLQPQLNEYGRIKIGVKGNAVLLQLKAARNFASLRKLITSF